MSLISNCPLLYRRKLNLVIRESRVKIPGNLNFVKIWFKKAKREEFIVFEIRMQLPLHAHKPKLLVMMVGLEKLDVQMREFGSRRVFKRKWKCYIDFNHNMIHLVKFVQKIFYPIENENIRPTSFECGSQKADKLKN